jgi:hypothetical protein
VPPDASPSKSHLNILSVTLQKSLQQQHQCPPPYHSKPKGPCSMPPRNHLCPPIYHDVSPVTVQPGPARGFSIQRSLTMSPTIQILTILHQHHPWEILPHITRLLLPRHASIRQHYSPAAGLKPSKTISRVYGGSPLLYTHGPHNVVHRQAGIQHPS